MKFKLQEVVSKSKPLEGVNTNNEAVIDLEGEGAIRKRLFDEVEVGEDSQISGRKLLKEVKKEK